MISLLKMISGKPPYGKLCCPSLLRLAVEENKWHCQCCFIILGTNQKWQKVALHVARIMMVKPEFLAIPRAIFYHFWQLQWCHAHPMPYLHLLGCQAFSGSCRTPPETWRAVAGKQCWQMVMCLCTWTVQEMLAMNSFACSSSVPSFMYLYLPLFSKLLPSLFPFISMSGLWSI